MSLRSQRAKGPLQKDVCGNRREGHAERAPGALGPRWLGFVGKMVAGEQLALLRRPRTKGE